MSEAVHTTRDDLQWSGRLAGSLDRTGVLGRVQLAQPQGRLAAEALVEHSVDERRGLLGGHVGLGGHMALQLTGRRGKERTSCYANMLCWRTYRKLVSTERRALVILLQRPGSVVSRILQDSGLSTAAPLTLSSMGVGM